MKFELAPFDLPVGYGEDIVSLAEIRDHLSLTGTSEFDTLLGFFRDAAIDQVERYCGIRLGSAVGLVWKSEWLCSRLKLGVWPVTAVTAIEWLDSTGASVAGDASIWRIGQRDEILLKPGQSLPSGVAAGVEITFTAGFTADNRPPVLVEAVKRFSGHLFANREDVITGSISGEIPLGFRALCRNYRMPVI